MQVEVKTAVSVVLGCGEGGHSGACGNLGHGGQGDFHRPVSSSQLSSCTTKDYKLIDWCTNRKSRLRLRWCELGPRRVAQADVRPWTWGMASPDGCSLAAGGLPSQLILRDLQDDRPDN